MLVNENGRPINASGQTFILQQQQLAMGQPSTSYAHRDPVNAPLRKLSVDLIKTYKNVSVSPLNHYCNDNNNVDKRSVLCAKEATTSGRDNVNNGEHATGHYASTHK